MYSQTEQKFNYEILKTLDESYGSSFFILDVEKLRDNYTKMYHAFQRRYENFIIGYSYKTNYLPLICKELSRLGAYAEVVSRLEYDLAIKIGEDPKRIIFNGPIKREEDIWYALKNGSIVHIDSLYEVEYVKKYAALHKNEEVKIGIRVNFDLSENGESILQDGYEVSRFGLCTENGSFVKAITALKEFANIKITSLHGHFSTKNRTIESYRKRTENICELAKTYCFETIEWIDIGGGIYGELPLSFPIQAPTFNDYAEVVCSVMNKHFPKGGRRPVLVLEPGVAMVANTMSFVAKVVEIKEIRDTSFVVVDGSVHNIKPTMHKMNLPMKIFSGNQGKERKLYHIVGYTCMEKDYLAYDVFAEIPKVGDYILFENVGAYTLVFNPPFIKERPAILALERDGMKMVRRKETFNQFFNEDLYVF